MLAEILVNLDGLWRVLAVVASVLICLLLTLFGFFTVAEAPIRWKPLALACWSVAAFLGCAIGPFSRWLF